MRPEGFDYETHSRLAGPFTEPDRTAYRVGYRSLLAREEPRTRIRAVLLMALAPSPRPACCSTSSGPRTGPSGRAANAGSSGATPRCSCASP